LSGDNEVKKAVLEALLPKGTELVFNQSLLKLEYIKKLQERGCNVMRMMV
jgi:Cu+-exporting ATPase